MEAGEIPSAFGGGQCDAGPALRVPRADAYGGGIGAGRGGGVEGDDF